LCQVLFTLTAPKNRPSVKAQNTTPPLSFYRFVPDLNGSPEFG
jgi:hypothetical protein